MDYHAITQRGAELVMRVVDGQLEIVPPPAQAPLTPAAHQVEPEIAHIPLIKTGARPV